MGATSKDPRRGGTGLDPDGATSGADPWEASDGADPWAPTLALILSLILPAALAAQPADFTRIGGAVFIGASKCGATAEDKTPCRPRWGAGYRLYQPAPWANLTGFIGPESFGLAACLRFPALRLASGRVVSFSAGPAYGMPLNGNGLGSGRLGGFFGVTVGVAP